MKCDLSRLKKSSYQMAIGYANLLLAWRLNGTSTTFSPLGVAPIPLVLLSPYSAGQSSSAASSGATGGANCSVNTFIRGCTSPAATCSLCAGNYQCMNTTCFSNTALSATPSIYNYPICNSSCSSNLVYDTVSKKCCQLGQQDCNGECGGSAKITTNPAGALVCCTATNLDCTVINLSSRTRNRIHPYMQHRILFAYMFPFPSTW